MSKRKVKSKGMKKKTLAVIAISLILVTALVALTAIPVLAGTNLVPIPIPETLQVQTGVTEYSELQMPIGSIGAGGTATGIWGWYNFTQTMANLVLRGDWWFFIDMEPNNVKYNFTLELPGPYTIFFGQDLTGDFNLTLNASQRQTLASYAPATTLLWDCTFDVYNNTDKAYIYYVWNFPIIENVTYIHWFLYLGQSFI
ncbi:MAG: hypothetical protein ACETWM_09260 [Candidatus Lokiarchaeia archaeon]